MRKLTIVCVGALSGLLPLTALAETQSQCQKDKAKAQGLVYWHRHKVEECRKAGDQDVLKGVPIDGTSQGTADTYYRSQKLALLAHLDGVAPEEVDEKTGKPKTAPSEDGAGFRGFLKKLGKDLEDRKSAFTPEQSKAAEAYQVNLRKFEAAIDMIRPIGATNSVTLANVDVRYNLLWHGCSVATTDDSCPGERSKGGINQLEEVFPDFAADVKRIEPKEDLEGDVKVALGSLMQMKEIQKCRDANSNANYQQVLASKTCPKVEDTGTDKQPSGLPVVPPAPITTASCDLDHPKYVDIVWLSGTGLCARYKGEHPNAKGVVTVNASDLGKPAPKTGTFNWADYGPCTADNPSGLKKKPFVWLGPTIGPDPAYAGDAKP